MGSRVLQRMSTIFAISRGLRERANPNKEIVDDLGKPGDRMQHHRSMPYQEVPAFIQRLRTCKFRLPAR
jgi:hypothetical protein